MTGFAYLRGLELLCHGKGQLDNYVNSFLRQPCFNEHVLFHTPAYLWINTYIYFYAHGFMGPCGFYWCSNSWSFIFLTLFHTKMSKVAVSAHLTPTIWIMRSGKGTLLVLNSPTVYFPFLLCLCICGNICVRVVFATLGLLYKITSAVLIKCLWNSNLLHLLMFTY